MYPRVSFWGVYAHTVFYALFLLFFVFTVLLALTRLWHPRVVVSRVLHLTSLVRLTRVCFSFCAFVFGRTEKKGVPTDRPTVG